jgi:hypothetical protein
MASSKEAFARLEQWRRSRTVLKLTILDGGAPEVQHGAITAVDEPNELANFVEFATRKSQLLDNLIGASFTLNDDSLEIDCLDGSRLVLQTAVPVDARPMHRKWQS